MSRAVPNPVVTPFARAIVALSALALAAFVTAIAVAGNFRLTAPGLALAVAPWDGQALAVRASLRLVTDPSKAGFASADKDVRRALDAEPVQAIALRVAGTIADAQGQSRRALALMTAAGRLSRRDALTQLLMIEYLSQTDDVPAVLRHYEIALTGSNESVPVLYPILIAAGSDAAMARPLADFLVRNRTREWRNSLLSEMITKSPGPQTTARMMLTVLRPTAPDDAVHYRELVDRLVPMAEYDLAFATFARVTGAAAASAMGLRDIAFERTTTKRFPPFDWQFADEADRSAQVVRDGGRALASLSASSTASGPMMRQVARLASGRYRLTVTVAGDAPPDGSLSAFAGCAPQPSDPSPVGERQPLVFRGGRAVADLTLPGGCAWRSIGIDYNGMRSGDDFMANIAALALMPLQAGAD